MSFLFFPDFFDSSVSIDFCFYLYDNVISREIPAGIAEKRSERDHKPGSVLDDHLSRPRVTAGLKRLRRTRRAAGLPPLHLAPGGVYSGNRLPGSRVSSCLAFPSLPPEGGGLFLLHSPWSRLHRPLAGTLALRCPDFPHASRHAIVCSPRTGFIFYSERP